MKIEILEVEKIIAELGAFGNMAMLSKTTDGRYVISATCILCECKEPKPCISRSTYCGERIWDIQGTGKIYLGKRDRVFDTLKDAVKVWLPIHLYFMSLETIKFTIVSAG